MHFVLPPLLLTKTTRLLEGSNVAVYSKESGEDGDQSINQSKRKTSNANGQTNLGHKHKAPDHNHEATQPMVDLPHTS